MGRIPAAEEGVETVINNIALIWNTPKDWSADAGLIWFFGLMLIGGGVMVTTALYQETHR